MNVLLPKFLRKTLAKRAQAMFPRRKRGRRDIPAHGRRRASEQKRAALATVVDRIVLEREDRLARERERGDDVCVNARANVGRGDIEERLQQALADVEERDTNA